ncbi:MAG: flagellar hook-basal body complex protein [Lachnospiraceae bacterium]|nr:flagellar hook-basal body complex protein [Lachnospiraceae bacterium]
MMRSLYSGISGLKVHQTKMDVIGNNISNVSTIGFRAGSANFTDVFYQTTQSASGPNTATGAAGTNAIQIGLGANLSSINVDLSGTGATQRTDRGMDIMINGDAFLIVQSNGNTYFTKSGLLDIDANGTLYCMTNGATVLGWSVDENGDVRKDIARPLNLMGGENAYSNPTATTQATMSGNIDREDPLVAYSEDGSGYITSVNFFDNLGNSYQAKLSIMKASDETDSVYTVKVVDVLGPDGKSILKKETTDDNGNPIYESTEQTINFGGEDLSYNVDADGEIIFDDANWPTLTFNGSTGAFTSVSSEDGQKLNLLLNDGSSTDNSFPLSGLDIDFSNLTMYATDGNSSVQPVRGDKLNHNGAGNEAGNLQGFSIQTDGKIYGVYSNGEKKLLGQIAVATFANPSGLEAVGDSMYAATMNSGDFDGIGIDISEVGKFSIGALEMSDVDLATEFVNMITTQRAFQANSRVITTSDSMLEELVNLKR